MFRKGSHLPRQATSQVGSPEPGDKRSRPLLRALGDDSFGPRDLVRRLSVAQQQVVEIAKAFSLKAHIVVMDEPPALAGHEVDLLYTLVRRLTARHRGPVCLPPAARDLRARRPDHVLKDGARVATAPASSLVTAALVRLLVGRDLDSYFPPRAVGRSGEVALTVRGGGNAAMATRSASRPRSLSIAPRWSRALHSPMPAQPSARRTAYTPPVSQPFGHPTASVMTCENPSARRI
ncbi:hypothetical protein [Nonomuraea sp. NPDC050783]|uniref:hypothetical protein n=1 Tax=Nonomuraea sp. NPDC050783 TaxID=3154634 RepID=UPI0034654A6E